MFSTLMRLALLVGLAFVPTLRADDKPNEEVRIGMVQGMFRDVKPATIRALATPLRDMIQKQVGLKGDVEIHADAFALAEGLKKKSCQLAVFHGFEYAWVAKNDPNIVPLAITMPAAKKLQACVVVHKEGTIQKLADLKKECVVAPKGTKMHCLLFLERSRVGFPDDDAKLKCDTLTADEALDGVVNSDIPAALVDVAALNGYQALQPGAFKNLRILCRSELFPPSVIAYRKGDLDEKSVERIRSMLVNADKTPGGKPLMMLWNLRGFEAAPADYQEQLDRIARCYPSPREEIHVKDRAVEALPVKREK